MRVTKVLAMLLTVLLLTACGAPVQTGGVAATTAPAAQFAAAICDGTQIPVAQVITDSVSCLHDYSLSVRQMQVLQQSDLVLLSGAGLEDFMEDVLLTAQNKVDCSAGIELLPMDEHGSDPHIWLSPVNAMVMAENICAALTAQYPAHGETFRLNTDALLLRLQELDTYGQDALSDLYCRKIITFHDGFAYLAQAYGLELLAAVEEESGSEASAADLIQIIGLVNDHQIPAVFTELGGSTAAASVIEGETGAAVFALDMAMGTQDYFMAMTYNFDTLKEALQ